MAESPVIKFKGDTKDAESKIKQLQKKLIDFSKGDFVTALGNLGKAGGAFGVVLGTLAKGVKVAKAALDECAEAYKVQAKAETQLSAAAKNNPYLNDSSVRALKAYAGQLQSISTVGDEKLLPLMAQLASAGRTQAEIQSIMSAALDASASGAISLESAVSGLNASYSGSVGALGKVLPQVKGLTAEELKQGKAVQVVADAYKGMAAEVAKNVGASEQLANAWGDFKENLGEGWEEATAPAKKEIASLLSQINEYNKWKKELKGAESNIESGKATEVDYEIKIEEVTDRLKSARAELEAVEATIESGHKDWMSQGRELETAWNLGEARKNVEALTAELVSYLKMKERAAKLSKEEADAAEKARVEAEKRKAAEEAMAAANKKAGDAVDAYNKAIADAQRKIEARRSLGEEITENEEKQIMLEARKSAYLSMIVQAGGTISGNLAREKKAREEIARLAAEIAAYDQSGAGLADKYAKKNQAAPSWEDQKKELEDAKAAIEKWNKETVSLLADGTDEKIALEKKYKYAVEQINREIAEGEKQSNEQRLKSVQEVFNQIGGYIQQSAQLISDAMAFQLQAVQNEKDYELAALEEKYRKGEITEQQYNDRKIEIEREAAQKEYKIKMWEWAANIAQATANTAMAAMGALAQTTGSVAARIIAMSLIGAAAGIQMASLIASKPVPPSFATGGIVQGSSWSGDNVRANVNSGEMILNATQQKALWETANGRGGNGGGMNVVINNSAANIVNAEPRITQRGIELLIDARVKQSLSDGKYNSALTQANQSMDGSYYGF